MRSLHLIVVIVHSEYATITADISETNGFEAMLDNSAYMQDIQLMAEARGCSIAYKLEVTFVPSNVRMFLNIMGSCAGKVVADIIKNA